MRVKGDIKEVDLSALAKKGRSTRLDRLIDLMSIEEIKKKNGSIKPNINLDYMIRDDVKLNIIDEYDSLFNKIPCAFSVCGVSNSGTSGTGISQLIKLLTTFTIASTIPPISYETPFYIFDLIYHFFHQFYSISHNYFSMFFLSNNCKFF